MNEKEKFLSDCVIDANDDPIDILVTLMVNVEKLKNLNGVEKKKLVLDVFDRLVAQSHLILRNYAPKLIDLICETAKGKTLQKGRKWLKFCS